MRPDVDDIPRYTDTYFRKSKETVGQFGDVKATYADVSAMTRDFGFRPKTPIAEGLPKFVAWYRDYHGM